MRARSPARRSARRPPSPLAVHNTPFGDIVDTEDDLQPLVAAAFRDAVRAVTLVAASLRGAELDVARLEARAAEGGTTLTELADHLVRTHSMPFTTAHAIAARLMQARRERPDAPLGAVLVDASPATCWACRCSTPTREIAEVMSPRHFVEVRHDTGRTGAGGDGTRASASRARGSPTIARGWTRTRGGDSPRRARR